MRDEAEQEALFAAAAELRLLATRATKLARLDLERRLAVADVAVTGSLQYVVLHLLQQQTYTLSELSRKFAMDPTTLVPVIDALERKGLITRGQDPRDRRRNPLTITAQGAAILARVPLVDRADRLVERLLALGPQKRAQLITLLQELVACGPDEG